MKVLIFCCLLAICHATAVYNYPYVYNSGTSQQYRNQDINGNYQFGYDVDHGTGGSFRKETGDVYGNKYGSYGLRDPDGRYRVVSYVADEAGFRADVKTNEPGVAPTDPASTSVDAVKTVNTVKTVEKPLLYAPIIHHASNPEFPLLYQAPYTPPSYGYYKGSAFTPRFSRPYISNYKGSPYRRYGYYLYP